METAGSTRTALVIGGSYAMIGARRLGGEIDYIKLRGVLEQHAETQFRAAPRTPQMLFDLLLSHQIAGSSTLQATQRDLNGGAPQAHARPTGSASVSSELVPYEEV
ncbi:hypothetical protein PF006_g12144 [Phytophthora fragariae]|uniref:Uncharacterized protein n=1 Tax=Phytophthora fragariae TaxID=53985 RepID=A0A6A3TZQ8_9STRA|nr:hypothetical protein PF006_g12144 [Phytophthora fragariae]